MVRVEHSFPLCLSVLQINAVTRHCMRRTGPATHGPGWGARMTGFQQHKMDDCSSASTATRQRADRNLRPDGTPLQKRGVVRLISRQVSLGHSSGPFNVSFEANLRCCISVPP